MKEIICQILKYMITLIQNTFNMQMKNFCKIISYALTLITINN
jgi:hypothetical protein